MAFLPLVSVTDEWNSIADARAWAKVPLETWALVAEQLGDPEFDDLLVLSAVEEDDYKAAMTAAGVKPLTKAALRLLFAAVKHKFGMTTTLSANVPSSTSSDEVAVVTAQGTASTMNMAAKIKLSVVIDQAKDQEVPMLSEEATMVARKRWTAIHDEPPLRASDPTDAQLTALNFVVQAGLAPYADFALWGPFGARHEKRMKFSARFMDSTGSWVAKEIAGPSSIDSWRECWAVFEAAAFMLNVASLGTLQSYASHFLERARRFSGAWHICCQADAYCRSEFLVAERRRQQAFHEAHPTISSYQANRPWNSAFAEAATSLEFWQRELTEVALLHRSVANAPPVPANTDTVPRGQQGGGKKARGDKTTEQRGYKRSSEEMAKEFCFKFTRSGQCVPWPGPCPDGRKHACEGCGRAGYTNAQCCRIEVPLKEQKKQRGKGKGSK